MVANDLLFKVIGYNKRNITLPIDISDIKKFCLSSAIKQEQLYDALLWISLRYVAIIRCIEWDKYLKNYE